MENFWLEDSSWLPSLRLRTEKCLVIDLIQTQYIKIILKMCRQLLTAKSSARLGSLPYSSRTNAAPHPISVGRYYGQTVQRPRGIFSGRKVDFGWGSWSTGILRGGRSQHNGPECSRWSCQGDSRSHSGHQGSASRLLRPGTQPLFGLAQQQTLPQRKSQGSAWLVKADL